MASCVLPPFANGVLDAQNVTVVSSGLQTAVAAAHDGDVLLITPGLHLGEQLLLSGKSLTLVGYGGVATLGPAQIFNIDAGRAVTCRGIAFTNGNTLGGISCQIYNCTGPVSFDGCTFTSAQYNPSSGTSNAGALVHTCTAVTFADCQLRGEDYNYTLGEAGPGLRVVASTVFAHRSACRGGTTTSSQLLGGVGARVHSGALLATSCTFTGGLGCTGGDALHVLAGASVVARDCVLTPGNALGGSCTVAGIPLRNLGSVQFLTGALDQATPALVRHGQSLQTSVTGSPGALAFALLALGLNPTPLPACDGALLIGPAPLATWWLGALPANGALTWSLPVPSLPIAGLPLCLQTAMVVPGSGCMLGAVHSVVVLDPSY